jgi:superfamily II DNA or RNA helicase
MQDTIDIIQDGGYDKKNYIKLKMNGKLFPTWIMANFSKYKLPEIMIDGSDPCNEKKMSRELRKYQDFLGKYLDYNSPYRDILVYHGLGSGKTRTAINIYNVLYNYSPDWNVYILLKATLRDSTWIGELERWLDTEEKEFRKNNIHFISYDAPNADKMFLEKVKNTDSAKKSLYIIDESHNFINNVYTNINSKQGRRALTIYEHMIQDKKENDGVRVVLISGSPAINNPFELALMFNLLRPNTFPTSETKFKDLYITNKSHPTINPVNKNSFQRRILGLVSHYIGSTPDYYAKKTEQFVEIPMSEYQQEIYQHFESIEEKIARKMRSSSGNYRSYTRQSCNFVFPSMSQGMTGETRPRPRDFKLKESAVESFSKGKMKDKDKQKYYEESEYFQRVNEFVNKFDSILSEKLREDVKNNYTIENDLENIEGRRKNGKINIRQFTKYMLDEKIKKSQLLLTLYNSSPKMIFMVLKILESKGPALVYSNYVLMEGLQIFKMYLKYFGFTSFLDKNRGKDFYRYMEYHGGINNDERRKVLKEFNRSENKYGAISKIIMISPAGAEGISLKNTRQVHIMEPYWHEVRIMQMIGRAIRQCSHKELPMEEREVDVFRYKSIKTSSSITTDKLTADQYIENTARSKNSLIQSFLDAMKEAAVDCELNKNHNGLVSKYRCFKFEEQTLFDKNIGSAYKEDIDDDLKINNGLNAPNSKVRRIKVIKIEAVRQLNENMDISNIKSDDISKKEVYWYFPESRTVYDYDMQYPIGKVGMDDGGLPLKMDDGTFIIDRVVPVPTLFNARRR